ncbi:MAG TPA: DUF2059 domain-containing protein [Opitutaceae bacterium]|nr:DUF2059 domain-containing protein [Lacunisphaera sp.]HWA10473.1 DUF2059 domain-containing protein [Opitutaceae bacterium]
MKLRLLVVSLFVAAAAHAADSVPLFNAVLSMGKTHRFVLAQPDGKASDWLNLGDTFQGYTIKAFDPATSTLDLERDGKTVQVKLVGDAATMNAPLPTKATIADAQALLNKMHFEEMIAKALEGQKKAMASMVDQMAAQSGRSNVNKEDMVAFQGKMMDEIMAAMNPSEMKDDVAKIYSDVFTKDELAGLSDFYSTPAGEALTAKQGEIQQKMQALMMPRMMAAMPKIRQMAQDFAAQQKAKAAAAAAPAAP